MLEKAGGARTDEEPLEKSAGPHEYQRDDSAVPGAGHSVVCAERLRNSMAGQILKRHVTNAYIELNKQNFKLINRDIETVNKVTSTVIQNSQIQRWIPLPKTPFSRASKLRAPGKIAVLLPRDG